MKKRTVVIGGGNGSALCLDGLKRFADEFDISAVIATSDSCGSSGRLRKEFGTLPTGDILRAILSLSKYDYHLLREIFYKKRFNDAGKLNEHNLGNLFLTLGANYSGDILKSISALEQAVEAMGGVLPATLAPCDLAVELDNGKVIKGDGKIDCPKYDRKWRIKKAWLEPEVSAYAGAVEALEKSDVIILSPGSLYTSVVAALLPTGIKEAIASSKAKLIFATGAYRTEGETGPMALAEAVKELEQYLPRAIDALLWDNTKLTATQKKYFAEKKWACYKNDIENVKCKKIVACDFRADDGGICSIKLGKELKKAIVWK